MPNGEMLCSHIIELGAKAETLKSKAQYLGFLCREHPLIARIGSFVNARQSKIA